METGNLTSRSAEPASRLHRGTNQSGMRDSNERLVLSLVRRHGKLAKTEIARMTGLSAQTVSVIMRELEDEGLQPWGGVRFVAFAGANQPTHGVDITGEPLKRGIASLAAHAEYTKGLGDAGFEPGPFLTWMAELSGPQIGVPAAALFDIAMLQFAGPLPWE